MAKPKRPRDTNQLAKLIADISVGDVPEPIQAPSKRRSGGLKGGAARAAVLTSDERSRISSIAAQARWKKRK